MSESVFHLISQNIEFLVKFCWVHHRYGHLCLDVVQLVQGEIDPMEHLGESFFLSGRSDNEEDRGAIKIWFTKYLLLP